MIDEKKLIGFMDVGRFRNPDEICFSENDVVRLIKNFTELSNELGLNEQPKADWIPCEERLPPQPKENPLFDNKPIEIYLVSLAYADYPVRAFWNGKDFTDGWSKLKVVEAWQPLPKPYKKEGAE